MSHALSVKKGLIRFGRAALRKYWLRRESSALYPPQKATQMDDLVERLREISQEKQQEAWGRADGGQDLSIGAMLADEAADEITALRARLEAVDDAAEVNKETTQELLTEVRYFKARAERAEAALEAANEGLTAAYMAGVADEKARQAEALATARRDAFLAGFKASGEGWNGEYPYEGDNPLEDKYFVDVMEREIRALANEAET